ncbi:Uncharacterised protein [BD1-7 clade bacterium]|uniref:DUF4124 domain-containing protein n=1 Tax=BD1-7 clade bacterium TaxID=2029982 RepID=A0A5S9PTD0_9GAMM|nr:Uncharacterised protein [BD1-7 clade bacterium]
MLQKMENSLKQRLPVLALFILLVLHSLAAEAEIYKWVDENGKVHFSDKKQPDKTQEAIELDIQPTSWKRFDIRIKTHDVTLTAKQREQIEKGVNYVYAFFDDVLYFDLYKTVPVSIDIYASESAYRQGLIEQGNPNAIRSFGMFFPKTNAILVYQRKPFDQFLRTIKHEVSHAILDSLAATIIVPSWVNEGIAEQMENIDVRDGRLVIQRDARNAAKVAYHASNGSLMGLKRFLSLPGDGWLAQHRAGNSLYPQSSQFVYFLLSTSPDRRFLTDLLHYYKRGGRKLSAYVTDDMAIGGIEGLQIRWNLWLKDQRPSELKF